MCSNILSNYRHEQFFLNTLVVVFIVLFPSDTCRCIEGWEVFSGNEITDINNTLLSLFTYND